jgi:hypothetical protein
LGSVFGGIIAPQWLQTTVSLAYSFKTGWQAPHSGQVRASFFFKAAEIAAI